MFWPPSTPSLPASLPFAAHIIHKVDAHKSLRLHVDPRCQKIILRTPKRFSQKRLALFLEAHTPWIEKQIAQFKAGVPLPQKITLLDQALHVRYQESQRGHSWQEGDQLTISAPTAQKQQEMLIQCIKKHTAVFFEEVCQRHAALLGKEVKRLTLKDTKTRWGSCHRGRGNINLSWRLGLAPREVARYVAIHEVCHLVEANHGPKFWALVQQFCPDYKAHCTWLRRHGQSLFARLCPLSNGPL